MRQIFCTRKRILETRQIITPSQLEVNAPVVTQTFKINMMQEISKIYGKTKSKNNIIYKFLFNLAQRISFTVNVGNCPQYSIVSRSQCDNHQGQ